jgi:hypothetical protein
MKDVVIKEALAATTQCRFAFTCLETAHCEGHPLCPGDRLLSERVLCVTVEEKRTCPYHLNFKHAQFCICPLRVALWKEFGNHWLGVSPKRTLL